MQGSPATLALFAQFIARTIGLHFTEERFFELEQKMLAVTREAGRDDVESYLLWLMSAPLSRELLDNLARALTIGETYFLRDPRSYQVLEEELLPGLIAQRRGTEKSLRIWSAGCSTGEEPYSLAILLSRIIPDLAGWNISLVATDINPQALERARRGIYSQWSFRNAPPWLMDYFTRCEDGRFEIIPRIRDLVRFDYLNLADHESPVTSLGTDHLDLVFCRNVMLYFEPKQIERTVARFHEALRDGGWLFVGPTEVDQSLLQGFSCRLYPGAFVLKKGVEKEAFGGGQHPPHSPTTDSAAQGSKKAASASGPHPSHPAAPRTRAALETPAGPYSRQEPAEAPQPAAPPGYPEALALYQAGSYEEAADSVRRALDAGPQPAEALALGARAFANLGRFSEARALCEQAIAADRLSAQSHYLHAIILEQQGDLAAAASALKNVLFIDQDYLLAYFALGNLSRQVGDAGESERNFGNALRILERRDPHEVLPEADGLTAGRLAQMIRGMSKGGSEHGRR